MGFFLYNVDQHELLITHTLTDQLWNTEPSNVVDSGIILYDLADNFLNFTRMKKNYADVDVDDRYAVIKMRIKNDACDADFRDRLGTVDWKML